jgi:hypothetical protein
MVGHTYTVEKSIRIYDDVTGDYIHVGPDSDGLNLVTIRSVDQSLDLEKAPEVILYREQALLVAKAIIELYGNKE